MAVLVETTIGDLVFDLYVKERPQACMNFLKLCRLKYYNFCLFFNVQQNFSAQCGDPTETGRGGESVFRRLYGDQACYFEMETMPPLRHEKLGTISMINNGDGMIGSQFFITLGENLTYLDKSHCVFGEVGEGFDTLSRLNETICDQNHRPLKDIRIMHMIVLEDPFPDPEGLEYPSRSPSPDVQLIKTKRIGVEESVDEDKDVPLEEMDERIASREARARAHVLEMVGDLHYAEERPPENVLFVCRLNPVTTEDDLSIIFSRFGKIIKCEIIRDKQTGSSLQYAFIEFEDMKSCEEAYFKMDNVLIDDRRIHVDFGQSVAKNYDWRKQMEEIAKRYERNGSHGRHEVDRHSKKKSREKSRPEEKHRKSRRSQSRSRSRDRRTHGHKKSESRRHKR